MSCKLRRYPMFYNQVVLFWHYNLIRYFYWNFICSLQTCNVPTFQPIILTCFIVNRGVYQFIVHYPIPGDIAFKLHGSKDYSKSIPSIAADNLGKF